MRGISVPGVLWFVLCVSAGSWLMRYLLIHHSKLMDMHFPLFIFSWVASLFIGRWFLGRLFPGK